MQSPCACIKFDDVFIPIHPSVSRDHMIYSTADWYEGKIDKKMD
jgi:hypothetical protein